MGPVVIETPQSFVVREECDKAAWHHGFRKRIGEAEGWASYASTTAQGHIFLAASGSSGPWLIATDHPGVVAEIGLDPSPDSGPGLARYRLGKLSEAYFLLDRMYQLASSLPDAPLTTFKLKTKGLPQSTEAERLVVQRIGQGIFRTSLMDYWQCCCPVTGVDQPELLRASHIIPWAECSDEERLNVYNGLLLSALWDAAFDAGLVTFDNDGTTLFSSQLSPVARMHMPARQIFVSAEHQKRLHWHRTRIFQP